MKAIVTMLAATIALAGWSFSGPLKRLWDRAHRGSFFDEQVAKVMAICEQADHIEVFEGLPHQRWESRILKVEQKRSDIFKHHGFHFYTPALALETGDQQALLSAVLNSSCYSQWFVPKYCGGFHPDLLVRFHHGADVTDSLLCFGCNEAKFFSSEGKSYWDMKDRSRQFWESLKKRLPLKRPDRKRENELRLEEQWREIEKKRR